MLKKSALQIDWTNGGNEATVVVGHFNLCLMVMRHDIQTEVLLERYANTYQYGFVAEMGFDVVLSHALVF